MNACRSATTRIAIKAYRPTGAADARCSGVKVVCVKPSTAAALDGAIGDIVIEAMTPLAIEVALLCSKNSRPATRKLTGCDVSTWSVRAMKRILRSAVS